MERDKGGFIWERARVGVYQGEPVLVTAEEMLDDQIRVHFIPIRDVLVASISEVAIIQVDDVDPDDDRPRTISAFTIEHLRKLAASVTMGPVQ